MKNELAGDIALAKGKSQYDTYCKRILANKIILAWILKYVAEHEELTEIEHKAADIDASGVSDSGDAAVILQYAAEEIDRF